MKKLLLSFCFIISSAFVIAQTTYQSLNGYPEATAKTMIAPFLGNRIGSQAPEMASVWFDRNILLAMDALLDSEVAKRRTDGIRIYFAYTNTHQATIVIVSTQDTGIPNQKSLENDNYHEDYYNHSSAATLYNNMQIPILGDVCYGSSCDGAALYTPSNDIDTCVYTATNPHYLPKAQCAAMVLGFVAQKENVNSSGEWFDLKLIDAFAKEINDKPFIDGIRIYFGRYASDHEFYPNKDAFVIVPTETIPNSNPTISRQDYFDCYMANDYFLTQKNETRVRKLKHLKSKKRHFKLFHFEFKTNPAGGGQDNGELCPDNCDI
jgi:hypothetical protein